MLPIDVGEQRWHGCLCGGFPYHPEKSLPPIIVTPELESDLEAGGLNASKVGMKIICGKRCYESKRIGLDLRIVTLNRHNRRSWILQLALTLRCEENHIY